MTDAEMKAALERLDEGGGSQWECDLFNAVPWLIDLAREALQARQSQPSMRMEVTPTPELMREFEATAKRLIEERIPSRLADALRAWRALSEDARGMAVDSLDWTDDDMMPETTWRIVVDLLWAASDSAAADETERGET